MTRSSTDRNSSTFRSFLDLLDVPLVLSQRPLLPADAFTSEARRRGAHLIHPEDLESLHRHGVLVPMFEVVRDVRWAKREASRSPGLRWDILNQIPPLYAPELRHARDEGRVQLVRARGFRSIAQRRRTHAGASYLASDYLYSPYQLLLLPTMDDARRAIGQMRGTSKRAEFARSIVNAVGDAARDFEWTVSILTALEPYYWPSLAGHLRMPVHYGPMENWWIEKQSLDVGALLKWLGWTADSVRAVAEGLIARGHGMDPLRRWLDLVRLVHPEHWDRLEGDALMAIELRRAGEMLLVFYGDLVSQGLAPKLPKIPWRSPHPLNERLKPDRARLDPVLTDFGLSPHPSVLLVVEGTTEMFVVSELMGLLGIPQRNSRIRVFELGGLNKDPDLLARYVRPSLRRFSPQAAEFETPPLRIMIVTDAEGDFRTAEQREFQRQRWINQYHAALPPEFQGPVPLAELGQLVSLETWSLTERDFEFAHFAPRTLALALLETRRVPPTYDRDRLIEEITKARRDNKGIRSVWKSWPDRKVLKLELWHRLWPRLRRRLRRADSDHLMRTPIARVLLLADELASRSRRGTLLRLAPEDSDFPGAR